MPIGLYCLADNSGVRGFTYTLSMPTIVFKICWRFPIANDPSEVLGVPCGFLSVAAIFLVSSKHLGAGMILETGLPSASSWNL